MGNTFKTGNYVNGIFQDTSNNIGIGAAPSGTYKFEVTGTSKVSGVLTLGSTLSNGTYTYTLPAATGTLALVGGAGVGTVTSVAATGGTGISITGSPITTSGTITITNTAPDQTVAITASTGISVTGTYPNFTITNTSPSSGGTVTSVAALTIGTTGTDLSSTVATSTTTPVITLNVPTASAANRGALSSADWTTFNNKQGTITLTTTGTSGAATFSANTLNIPNYGSALTSYVPYSGATTNVNLGAFYINTNYGYFTHGTTGQDWLTRTNNTTGNYEIVDWSSTVARVYITAAGAVTFTGALSGTSAVFSGQFSIGTTAPAWSAFTNMLNLQGGSIGGTSTTDFRIFQNMYYDGGSYRTRVAGESQRWDMGSGALYIYSAASAGADAVVTPTLKFSLLNTGAATFSSSVSMVGLTNTSTSTFSSLATFNGNISLGGNSTYFSSGAVTLGGALSGTSASFSSSVTATGGLISSSITMGGNSDIISASSNSGFLTIGSTQPIRFTNTSTSEWARFTNTGNLLIGTTTDYTSKLVIIPSSNPTSSTGANNQISIGETSNNTGYCLKLGYINTGGGYQGSIQSIAGGSGSTLFLNASGGNVLIGTTADDTVNKLQVNGNIAINKGAGNTAIFDTNNTRLSLALGGTANFTNFSGMILVNSYQTGSFQILVCGGGSTASVYLLGGAMGTLAYNAGINGYTYTITAAATSTYNFTAFRTRPDA